MRRRKIGQPKNKQKSERGEEKGVQKGGTTVARGKPTIAELILYRKRLPVVKVPSIGVPDEGGVRKARRGEV